MQNRYEKTELPGCPPFSKKLWFAIPNISCSKRKSFFLSVVLNQPYMVIHVPELWKININFTYNLVSANDLH